MLILHKDRDYKIYTYDVFKAAKDVATKSIGKEKNKNKGKK